MYIINEFPGKAAKEKGAALVPDDFPNLKAHPGCDFYAWYRAGIWHIETTRTGDALEQTMKRLDRLDNKRFDYAKSPSIARRLASQMWGRVERQRKLAEGIWLFTTPGHGGVVVDTDIRPELEKYKTDVTNRGNYISLDEQHFAAFEEDCLAAIPEWLYCNDIHTDAFRQYFVNPEGLSPDAWFHERKKILERSLTQWNPEVLEEYPRPGMGKSVKGPLYTKYQEQE